MRATDVGVDAIVEGVEVEAVAAARVEVEVAAEAEAEVIGNEEEAAVDETVAAAGASAAKSLSSTCMRLFVEDVLRSFLERRRFLPAVAGGAVVRDGKGKPRAPAVPFGGKAAGAAGAACEPRARRRESTTVFIAARKRRRRVAVASDCIVSCFVALDNHFFNTVVPPNYLRIPDAESAAKMKTWIASIMRALLLPCLLSVAVLPSCTSKKHILAILMDDYGWADAGWHAHAAPPPSVPSNPDPRAEVQTPHLDELVRDGIELDRHYVFKVCSPTRSAAQTGRNPLHVNAVNLDPLNYNPKDNVSGYSAVPRNMTGIAEVLRDKGGMQTRFYGKWDCGMATMEHTPKGRGYQRSLSYFHHMSRRPRRWTYCTSAGRGT